MKPTVPRLSLVQADEPEAIALQLEALAAEPEAASRSTLKTAKELRQRLQAYKADRKAEVSFYRGQAAYRTIARARKQRRARQEQDEAANLTLKRRIVAAIGAAARSATPLHFVQEVRQIRELFNRTGSAGPDDEQLDADLKAASAQYRTAVSEARKARRGAPELREVAPAA